MTKSFEYVVKSTKYPDTNYCKIRIDVSNWKDNINGVKLKRNGSFTMSLYLLEYDFTSPLISEIETGRHTSGYIGFKVLKRKFENLITKVDYINEIMPQPGLYYPGWSGSGTLPYQGKSSKFNKLLYTATYTIADYDSVSFPFTLTLRPDASFYIRSFFGILFKLVFVEHCDSDEYLTINIHNVPEPEPFEFIPTGQNNAVLASDKDLQRDANGFTHPYLHRRINEPADLTQEDIDQNIINYNYKLGIYETNSYRTTEIVTHDEESETSEIP